MEIWKAILAILGLIIALFCVIFFLKLSNVALQQIVPWGTLSPSETQESIAPPPQGGSP